MTPSTTPAALKAQHELHLLDISEEHKSVVVSAVIQSFTYNPCSKTGPTSPFWPQSSAAGPFGNCGIAGAIGADLT